MASQPLHEAVLAISEQALTIPERFLPLEHPDIAVVHRNLKRFVLIGKAIDLLRDRVQGHEKRTAPMQIVF